jgi:hypothetical protein
MSVQIRALIAGSILLETSVLSYIGSSQFETVSPALATLEVAPIQRIGLTASIAPGAVPIGGTKSIAFQLSNRDRDSEATDYSFSVDLDAGLTGLSGLNLPRNDRCGTGSSLSGSTTITFSGGTLAAMSDCTFTVDLQIPADAAKGIYTLNTAAPSATIAGVPITGHSGSTQLQVATLPVLSFNAVDASTQDISNVVVTAGSNLTLRYSINNPSSIENFTGIAVQTSLDETFPSPLTLSLPTEPCSVGSLVEQSSFGENPMQWQLTGAGIASEQSCSFDVTIALPEGMSSGVYQIQTGALSGQDDDSSLLIAGSTTSFTVVAAPLLVYSFSPNVVPGGQTTTLNYELYLGESSPTNATAIAFTHDIATALSGLTIASTPDSSACAGNLTAVSGGTQIALSDGVLEPDSSCAFAVQVQVPVAAPPGEVTSTTGDLTATAAGKVVSRSGSPASFSVGGVVLGLAFSPASNAPGDTITASMTLTNLSQQYDATNIEFDFRPSSSLTDFALTAGFTFPDQPCGAISSLSGSSTITFSGGSISAGEICTFHLDLDVPAGASVGRYRVSTSAVSATLSGGTVFSAAGSSELVLADPLLISKTFTPNRSYAGAQAVLTYTLYNSSTDTASALTFTDDFGSLLTGFTAAGSAASDVCGVGSSISGEGLLTFAGGSIAAQSECEFSVSLQLPESITTSGSISSTSSTLTGNIGSSAAGATDVLYLDYIRVEHSYVDPVAHGGTTTLTYTIENLSGNERIVDLHLVHDLDNVVSGATASAFPGNGFCGANASASGTNLLLFEDMELAPSSSCSFSVSVQIPQATAVNNFVSTTGAPTSYGAVVGGSSTDTLTTMSTIPSFAAQFEPNEIVEGNPTELVLSISNVTGNGLVGSLSLNIALPTGLSIASPLTWSSDCPSLQLDALAGANTFSFSGGEVASSSACFVRVSIAVGNPGSFVLSPSSLTTSSGPSTVSADATLTVQPTVPVFSTSFIPNIVNREAVTSLQLRINNTSESIAVTNLTFNDVLPAGLLVNDPSAVVLTTCGSGVLSVGPNLDTIALSNGEVLGGGVCTLDIPVVASVAGVITYSAGDLISASGVSPVAEDSQLSVLPKVPIYIVSFYPETVVVDTSVNLNINIDNTREDVALTSIALNDVLPSGLVISNADNVVTTCDSGTLTVDEDVNGIQLTGAGVAANQSCAFIIPVHSSNPGTYTFQPTNLTSSAGTSVVESSAVLTVVPNPPIFSASFEYGQDIKYFGEFGNKPLILDFTIDNSLGEGSVLDLSFNDTFEDRITVVSMVSSSCAGTQHSIGADKRSFTFSATELTAGRSCSFHLETRLTIEQSDYEFNRSTFRPYTYTSANLLSLSGVSEAAGSAEIDLRSGLADDGGCTCSGNTAGGLWALLTLLPCIGQIRRRRKKHSSGR